jgi:tRNA(Arg) A34 adenosine deaminase TadA
VELGPNDLGRLSRLTRRAWLALAASWLFIPLSWGSSHFARRALELRDQAARHGDQPYGAVVVKDGKIVGEAPSRVLTNQDPTAHAEMEAIRDAARKLGTRDLSGCELYGSSPACRMCEAAAYWANIARLHPGDRAPRL